MEYIKRGIGDILKGISRKIYTILKKVLQKLPVVKLFFKRIAEQREMIERQQNVISRMEVEVQQLTERVDKINVTMPYKRIFAHRFMIKKVTGIPVKVAFLIEEPSVIKNIFSVIQELGCDERFEVVLINLWYKVYKGDSYTYKRPNIESVIDITRYNVVEAYDTIKDKWFSLESLLPDYVFFSRPYDFYRNESYHIKKVSEYARTCYVPYGIQTIGGEVEKMVLTPECASLYYFFMDNAIREDYIKNALQDTCFKNEGNLLYLGYPGIDMLRSHEKIKQIDSTCFTILWLPRWNNTENNCHFFEYADFLSEYVKKYDDCRIILRPHPLCFENFLNTGELTEADLTRLISTYSKPNEIDETSDYIEAFCKSSVLVADETSLIAEYFLTEKPIIFCRKETHFSLLMEKLVEGCYIVDSQEELFSALEQLKEGNDILKTKRKQIAETLLLDYGESAAYNIKEELWADFISTCKDI